MLQFSQKASCFKRTILYPSSQRSHKTNKVQTIKVAFCFKILTINSQLLAVISLPSVMHWCFIKQQTCNHPAESSCNGSLRSLWGLTETRALLAAVKNFYHSGFCTAPQLTLVCFRINQLRYKMPTAYAMWQEAKSRCAILCFNNVLDKVVKTKTKSNHWMCCMFTQAAEELGMFFVVPLFQ